MQENENASEYITHSNLIVSLIIGQELDHRSLGNSSVTLTKYPKSYICNEEI